MPQHAIVNNRDERVAKLYGLELKDTENARSKKSTARTSPT